MAPTPPLRAVARAACLVAALAGHGGPALAAGVPTSALSVALQMHPSLVDSPAQIVEHPQAAALGGSSIFSLDGYDYSSPGALGVTWDAAEFLSIGATAHRNTDDLDYGGANVRAGLLAARIGAFRLGAAVRHGSWSDKSEDENIYVYSDDIDRNWTRYRSSFALREFAGGLGWSRGRAFVDVTTEFSEIDASNAYRREDSDDTPEATELDIVADRHWGGSLRAAAPLDESTTVTVAGAFRDRRADVRYRVLTPFQTWATFLEPTYGHRWSAHLDVARDVRAGRLHLHGGYADTRGPVQTSQYGLDYNQRRRETAEAGASLVRPGWWETTLYLGARAIRNRTWDDRYRFRPDSRSFGSFSRSSNFGEAWTQAFSWGASRSIGDLDLIAVVSRNLQISTPFAALDARFRF